MNNSRLITLAALGALAVAAVPIAAFAQSIEPVQYKIDLRPLVDQVLWPALGIVATALATWLAKRTADWLKISDDARVRDYLDQALQNAISYARSQSGGVPLTVGVRNEMVAKAANYAAGRVPDALKRFGIDDDALRRMLAARIAAQEQPK
jgi:hypothetical protein